MRFRLVLLVFILTWLTVVGCQQPPEPSSTPPIQTTVIGGLALGPESYPVATASREAEATTTGQPEATATPQAYAPPASTPSRPVPTTHPASGTATTNLYLPWLERVAPTATPQPSPTATPLPSPTPTIDFREVRETLRQNQQDLGFVKIGFHVGPGGNQNGLGEWMRRLDEAGVPFFLKSADAAGPLTEAQTLMRNSDVPHTLVYRSSGDNLDVPDYNLPPAEAARQHWERHKAAFPPELDPEIVWFETINEVDKNRSEWLAQFALHTARLALADGYRWAAFGWSSGEPEPHDWQSPAMLEFLRLAAANPDRLAISLHEYSYRTDEIAHQYPYKVGRFQELFRIVDAHGIPRPTVLITEWGWEYQNVPPVGEAMDHIAWASRLYAHYPEVKGAALWYLGPGYNGIADPAQALVTPLTEYALGNYFAIPLPPAQAPIAPERYAPVE